MDREEAKQLIDKYLTGACTAREKRLVEAWYNQLLKEEKELLAQPDWQRVKETIFDRLPPPQNKSPRRWISIAASILLVALAGLYFWQSSQINPTQCQLKEDESMSAMKQVILTLSNGMTVELDSNQKGIKIDRSSIQYLDGKSLAIKSNAKGNFTQGGLKLSTPIGRQFEIILEDDTRVLLNAASTLSCLQEFEVDKREVNLEGEAFFEVTENKKRPFYVLTSSQEIKVLGTSFAVSAFAEDELVKTTLQSGVVRVNPINQTVTEIVLSPGEQATLSKDNILRKDQVDLSTELSWMEGNFLFQSEDIMSVMRKLERWYDIEVYYEGTATTERYSGVIPRYKNVSKVLEMLEKTKTVHFKIEERRITVMQ